MIEQRNFYKTLCSITTYLIDLNLKSDPDPPVGMSEELVELMKKNHDDFCKQLPNQFYYFLTMDVKRMKRWREILNDQEQTYKVRFTNYLNDFTPEELST